MFHGPNRAAPRIALELRRRNRPFLKATATIVAAVFLLLTLQPPALAADLTARRPSPPPPAPTDAERLSQTLEHVERHLEKLETKLSRRQDVAPEHKELKALRDEINVLDRQALADFDAIAWHLKEKNLPPEILNRHTAAVKTYKTEMTALKTHLGEVYWANDDSERRLKAKKAREHLAAKKKKEVRPRIDPHNLPTRALKPNKNNKPKLRKEEFRAAGLYDNPTVKLAALGDFTFDKLPGASDPAYLAETPDIRISPAIRAKAQELNYDPVKIYQFVRNNIEWVPSWGSIQGADLTLKSLKGNSLDTASLLIALLRASGIPARYVHGTIEVPVEKFMNWAGGFTNPYAAMDFASSGGIPITAVVAAGKVSAVRLEHVWVESAIDYHPSRGAINKAADSWVQLDASFKQYDITPGLELSTTVPFNDLEYLSQIRPESPVMYYQRSLQAYLDANLPDKTLGDVVDFMSVKLDQGSFLPSSLPYKVLVSANRYGTLPSALRVTAQFEFNRLNQIDPEQFSLDTVSLAGKRLTLVYEPASPSDVTVIAQYGGDLYVVPPYLLFLAPTLKADGQVLYQGSAIQMGSEQTLTIVYNGPNLIAQSIPHKLISGGYSAVGLNLQGTSHLTLGDKNYRLIETLTTLTPQTAPTDSLIGEHLYALMLTWFLANDKQYRGAARLYRVAEQRTLSAGLVSFTLTVRYFFGIPRSASPNRARFDVGLEATQAISREGSLAKRNAYLELRGLQGSYSEHGIFEAIHGFDSVSAVKGLQAANAQGIPVYTLDQTNFAQLFPTLQLAGDDLLEIQQGVQAGLIAIVPQREITLNDWTGAGYIVKDPQTHSGVYRISGGLAGGSTTKNADGFQIVSLFKGAFAWLKDKLDVMTRSALKLAAELLGAGITVPADPLIAKAANALLGEGYEDVYQCSGLVRLAYEQAGMCLDFSYSEDGKWKSCPYPPSIAQQAGVTPAPSDNGVKIHYNIANALKLNRSIRTTNDPLAGDIVFFNNTTGPNRPLNHEGIVVAGPDSNGTIEFIHATSGEGANSGGTGGVIRSKMNISRPGDQLPYNSLIGDPKRCGTQCGAGQLFAGYGTIRDPRTLK